MELEQYEIDELDKTLQQYNNYQLRTAFVAMAAMAYEGDYNKIELAVEGIDMVPRR